jgi:Inward rectifier potassium channel C-terminal domain
MFPLTGADSLPSSTNTFFESGCPELQIAVLLQMMWSMLFNAFLFAFFYSLLSKSEFRSSQIVFTNKLLINSHGGKVYARLQCYDIDSAYPLVEAHARMYVLDHKLKMHPLRLCDPNDDLGGMLYPSVPADIVHHIDHHSILSPRKMPLVDSSSGLVLRSLDSLTNNREEIVCPICGESYGSHARLKKHVEYNAMLERKGNYPRDKSHVGFKIPDIEPLTLEEVRSHIERTLSEIVVVVEAIDPQLSGTFQSLQSYKYEDIEFDAEYNKCMFVQNEQFTVDMKKFHTVKYIDDDASSVRRNEEMLMEQNGSMMMPSVAEDLSEADTDRSEEDLYLGRSYRTFQSSDNVLLGSDYMARIV